MIWMPASPRWLLLKGRVDEAERALRAFRITKQEQAEAGEVAYAQGINCDDRVGVELENMKASFRNQTKSTVMDLWRACCLCGAIPPVFLPRFLCIRRLPFPAGYKVASIPSGV